MSIIPMLQIVMRTIVPVMCYHGRPAVSLLRSHTTLLMGCARKKKGPTGNREQPFPRRLSWLVHFFWYYHFCLHFFSSHPISPILSGWEISHSPALSFCCLCRPYSLGETMIRAHVRMGGEGGIACQPSAHAQAHVIPIVGPMQAPTAAACRAVVLGDRRWGFCRMPPHAAPLNFDPGPDP